MKKILQITMAIIAVFTSMTASADMNTTVSMSPTSYTPGTTVTVTATVGIASTTTEYADWIQFVAPAGVTMTAITPSGRGACGGGAGVQGSALGAANGVGWGASAYAGTPTQCGPYANGSFTLSFQLVIPPTYTGPLTIGWNANGDGWNCGAAGCSCGTFTCDAGSVSLTQAIPTPVSLSSFIANKVEENTIMSWTTETENNNSRFNVERSINGLDFDKLGEVYSKAENGNSNSRLQYNYTDINPIKGQNYYRLKQIDIDGNSSYSEIIDIIFAEGNLIRFYPNPVKEILNIDLETSQSSKVDIKVLDLSGRIVRENSFTSVRGLNNFKMSLIDISTGVYQVQLIENNTIRTTQRLTIQ